MSHPDLNRLRAAVRSAASPSGGEPPEGMPGLVLLGGFVAIVLAVVVIWAVFGENSSSVDGTGASNANEPSQAVKHLGAAEVPQEGVPDRTAAKPEDLAVTNAPSEDDAEHNTPDMVEPDSADMLTPADMSEAEDLLEVPESREPSEDLSPSRRSMQGLTDSSNSPSEQRRCTRVAVNIVGLPVAGLMPPGFAGAGGAAQRAVMTYLTERLHVSAVPISLVGLAPGPSAKEQATLVGACDTVMIRFDRLQSYWLPGQGRYAIQSWVHIVLLHEDRARVDSHFVLPAIPSGDYEQANSLLERITTVALDRVASRLQQELAYLR